MGTEIPILLLVLKFVNVLRSMRDLLVITQLMDTTDGEIQQIRQFWKILLGMLFHVNVMAGVKVAIKKLENVRYDLNSLLKLETYDP